MSGTVNSVRHYNSGCLRYTVSLMFKEAPDCQKKKRQKLRVRYVPKGLVCKTGVGTRYGRGFSISELAEFYLNERA